MINNNTMQKNNTIETQYTHETFHATNSTYNDDQTSPYASSSITNAPEFSAHAHQINDSSTHIYLHNDPQTNNSEMEIDDQPLPTQSTEILESLPTSWANETNQLLEETHPTVAYQ